MTTSIKHEKRPDVFGNLHAGVRAHVPRNRRHTPGPAEPVGDYGPAVVVTTDPRTCKCPDCRDLIVDVTDVETGVGTTLHRPADWPVLVVTA